MRRCQTFSFRQKTGLSNFVISAALMLSLSSCGGPTRASVEKMLENPEPDKVAKNLDSLLKKLEHPKNKILPDPRCAMMTVAVELADMARGFPADEQTGEPFVSPEQYTRLRNLLIKEIDQPGIYYKEAKLQKLGYQSSLVKKHLSSWATYELANSDFGGREKLNKMLAILGNAAYGGHDLAWQRAAAFDIIRQIDLIKKDRNLPFEVLNRLHRTRVLSGLPSDAMNSAQSELKQLIDVIESHILTLPLMNRSLQSLRNNPDKQLIIAAVRRNYRLLDRLVDTGINESSLQRHLYANIEMLRELAFNHEDEQVHAYARNTLVRFAPFTYLDGVISSQDNIQKKRWVQETIQILPVMDAYMATVTLEDLEVFALPAFTQARVKLEDAEKERAAHKRAQESAQKALKEMDQAIRADEAGHTLLPDPAAAADEERKLFLALEHVSARIINPVLYFPINNFVSKRQNFLDQTFSLMLSYPSAERSFILSELYKQEPVQLLNYFLNNHQAEQQAGQDYALQDMLILGNLSNDKRLSEDQQQQARQQAVWYLTQPYAGGDIRDLLEAGMQFIYPTYPMVLAGALRNGLNNFNGLSEAAAWEYAKAYTAALQLAIKQVDADNSGTRPDDWPEFLQVYEQIHDRRDFKPFTLCIPFLRKENPHVLIDILLTDKVLQSRPAAETEDVSDHANKQEPDPKNNYSLVIPRALVLIDVLKQARSRIDKVYWDKSIAFMLNTFTESNNEELDFLLARALIELEQVDNKPTAQVINVISNKHPGFASLINDLDAAPVEASK